MQQCDLTAGPMHDGMKSAQHTAAPYLQQSPRHHATLPLEIRKSALVTKSTHATTIHPPNDQCGPLILLRKFHKHKINTTPPLLLTSGNS